MTFIAGRSFSPTFMITKVARRRPGFGDQPCPQTRRPTKWWLSYCAFSKTSKTLPMDLQFQPFENPLTRRMKASQNQSTRYQTEGRTPSSSELPQRCLDFVIPHRQG